MSLMANSIHEAAVRMAEAQQSRAQRDLNQLRETITRLQDMNTAWEELDTTVGGNR